MTTSLQEQTVISSLRQPLRSALAQGARDAAQRGGPLLVCVTISAPPIDPLALFEAAGLETPGLASHDRAFWQQPEAQFSLAALGVATRLVGSGSDRFDQVAAAWRRLTADAVSEPLDGCPVAAPVCLGGFSFEATEGEAADSREDDWQDYPDALLTVPRFLFVSQGGSSWLIASALVGPGDDAESETEAALADLSALLARADGASVPEASSDDIAVADEADAVRLPDAVRWKETVAAVVREIESGTVRKLVLARRVSIRADEPIAWGLVLRRLRTRYAGCTTFAFARGASCFLGATPERLVRLDGRTVRVDCLAGSAPRGATEGDDRSLAEALLRDQKERHEHALVVEALRETLTPLASALNVPEEPRLLQMPNVHHLHTPVEATLSDERHVLDLVARLHPTPASGGVPQDAARALIQSHEPFDRGWYAGPVGWIDGRGGGEFVVAIRSALLREREALLYAGCGIVAGSDPDREYEESRLKLEPMLWAMNGKDS